MNEELEKWLIKSANSIVDEFTENTVSGKTGLEEFASYAGNENAQELVYRILKRTARHTEYVMSQAPV